MIQRLYGVSANRARFLNVGMLIAGFGFGQGAIFLAQTWLMAQGKLHLMALFGTHFSFAILGIILVEAGSLVTLARHSASLGGEEVALDDRERSMWKKFWEVSAFRMTLALTVVAVILIVVAMGTISGFSRSYALYAAPAFVIWAVNAAGFLDGLKLSGISGISGSVAYISSAVALLVVQSVSEPVAGMILGAAFTIGYASTVCIQVVALRAAGWKVRFERPASAGILSAARDGAALLGSTLPGQLYFRAQLLMSSMWLGVAPTAMLIYVKQVITAAAQIVGCIRRVEFPMLVTRLVRDASTPIATIMHTQRFGTWLAGVFTIVIFMAGLALIKFENTLPAGLGLYLTIFATSIVPSAVVLTLGQGLSALGMYHTLFVKLIASYAAGLIVSLALIIPLGLFGIFVADLAAAAVGIIVLINFFRIHHRSQSNAYG